MYEAYAQDIDQLRTWPVDLTRLAQTAMSHATAAVLETESPQDDRLVAVDRALHELHQELEGHASAIRTVCDDRMPADQPVIVAGVHINAAAENMATLARHLADIGRTRPSRPPIPDPLLTIVREMSLLSHDLAGKAADIVALPGARDVAELVGACDELDRLQHRLYWELFAAPSPVPVESAIDATLIARYCERYAHHALAIARHGVLLALRTLTG